MNYNYILDPKAQQEYENSIEWYSERSELVTLNFIDTIESTIAVICKNPYLYKKGYKNFHAAVTKKYPYSIVYAVEEKIKTVVIISVFQNNRSPKKKYKK